MSNILCEVRELRAVSGYDTRLQCLNLEYTERIIQRLISHPDCAECGIFLKNFEYQLKDVRSSLKDYHRNKDFSGFIKRVVLHLQKNHRLIPEGHYRGVFSLIGNSFGLTAGSIFSLIYGKSLYLTLGICLGICLGVGLGNFMELRAKNQGRII